MSKRLGRLKFVLERTNGTWDIPGINWHEVTIPTTKSQPIWPEEIGDPKWPIHSKFVEAMKLHDVRKWLADRGSMETLQLLEYVRDPSIYSAAQVPTQDFIPNSRINIKQAKELVQNKIVEPIEKREVRSIGLCFLTPEASRKRWRVIMDTLGVNVAVRDGPKISFSTLRKLKRIVLNNAFCALFDFKCYYFQFPVEHGVAVFFAFRRGSKFFVFVRAPMGCKFMVSMAHKLTCEIASATTSSDWDVIIDNILFADLNAQALTETCQRFQALCDLFGITIGSFAPPAAIGEYRGLRMDFTRKQIGTKHNWNDKFCKRVTACIPQCTVAQLRSIFGMATWMLAVYEEPRTLVWSLGRLLAKCEAAFEEAESLVVLPSEAVEELTKLRDVASANHMKLIERIQPRNGVKVLVTDACELGWAGVLLDDDVVLVVKGKFQPGDARMIAAKEFDALLFSLFSIDAIRECPLDVFLDNTTVLAVIRNASSRDETLSQQVTFLRFLEQEKNLDTRYFYIPTKENIADAPSRGLPISKFERWHWKGEVKEIPHDDTEFYSHFTRNCHKSFGVKRCRAD